jgi:hypothetical protein
VCEPNETAEVALQHRAHPDLRGWDRYAGAGIVVHDMVDGSVWAPPH